MVVVDYINLMSSIGYPLSKQQLLWEVKRILDADGRQTKFTENLPGNDWYRGFLKRHPELSERKPQGISTARAAITKEMVEGWFATANGYIAQQQGGTDALKDPRRVWNMDETAFPLDSGTGKVRPVLVRRGTKNVYAIKQGDKTQITVVGCCNAIGDFMKPYIVYPAQRLTGINYEKFPDALYSNTPTGWMNQDEFDIWIRCFDEYVNSLNVPKPVILFLDGHSSHLGLEASKYCRSNNIILYCLLPNATHILQPFDVGIFSPLKDSWAAAVLSWQICNIGEPITKQNFNVILEMAWRNTTTNDNGKAVQMAAKAFRRTGLYPFDATKVDYLRTLSGKQEEAKSTYFAMMAKQHEQPKEGDKAEGAKGKLPRPNIPPPAEPSTSGWVPPPAKPSTSGWVPEPNIATQAEPNIPPPAEPRSTQDGATPDGAGDGKSKYTPKSFITPTSNKRPRDDDYVTPHMAALRVPEPKSRRKPTFVRQILPKGLSGDEAIRIREERLAEIKRLDEAKEQRKIEREEKRKKREEDAERKRVIQKQKKAEREAKKKQAEIEKQQRKSIKRKKGARREITPPSSPSESEKEIADDSSDDEAQAIDVNVCYRCTRRFEDDTGGPLKEPVGCDRCPRWYHFGCLPAIIQDQVELFFLDINGNIHKIKKYVFHLVYHMTGCACCCRSRTFSELWERAGGV